jgi:hypothetical protein
VSMVEEDEEDGLYDTVARNMHGPWERRKDLDGLFRENYIGDVKVKGVWVNIVTDEIISVNLNVLPPT